MIANKLGDDILKFKSLALANGDIFENGSIKTIKNEISWLPNTFVVVQVRNQEILVNTDYVLSLELEKLSVIS